MRRRLSPAAAPRVHRSWFEYVLLAMVWIGLGCSVLVYAGPYLAAKPAPGQHAQAPAARPQIRTNPLRGVP